MIALDHLLTVEATLERRSQDGPADRYGTPGWQTTSETIRCFVWPATGDELAARPAGTLTHKAVIAPDVTVDARARLIIDGGAYEIVAPPGVWWHPDGAAFQTLDLLLLDDQ
jgi:hypothetical protein